MNSSDVAKRIRSILDGQRLKVEYERNGVPLSDRAYKAHKQLSELAEILEMESVIESLDQGKICHHRMV